MKDEHTVIIDSRSFSEYTGKMSRAKRKGHIPTAHFLSADASFSLDGNICQLHDLEKLKKLYSSLDKKQRYYLYCNSGRSATVNYLVLRLLGYSAAVYDGSWYEWASDDNLPIIMGEDPGSAE